MSTIVLSSAMDIYSEAQAVFYASVLLVPLGKRGFQCSGLHVQQLSWAINTIFLKRASFYVFQFTNVNSNVDIFLILLDFSLQSKCSDLV